MKGSIRFGALVFAAALADLACTSVANATPVPTTTVISSNDNPALVGDSVGLTATVVAADSSVPNGSVTFEVNFLGSLIETSASTLLPNTTFATATFNATFTTAGDYDITASYSGDDNHEGSTEIGYVEVVNSPATSVPEPVTLSLFGAGLIGAAAMRRRKTDKAI